MADPVQLLAQHAAATGTTPERLLADARESFDRLVADLDTGPRELPCGGECVGLTLHHYDGDEARYDGLVNWWRCEVCKVRRSFGGVAIAVPVTHKAVRP